MTKIGFIGQGWIGKHYADEFEARLYDVVRYSLEEPYVQNKEQIKECDIVFIAVPTPTTPQGFNYEPVRNALLNLKPGATAVIKSTLKPGTTELLQAEFKDIYVLHSPEFLVEKTAALDAAKPKRNLIGIPIDTPEYQAKAESVLKILPEAPYVQIMSAREAELVKYAGNCFLMTKLLFMNLLYDLVEKNGANWESVRTAFSNDPRIGESHTNPVSDTGRGAGGHCFIKDFEAFRLHYRSLVDDKKGQLVLKALTEYNIELLTSTNKDLELLRGVFGVENQVS